MRVIGMPSVAIGAGRAAPDAHDELPRLEDGDLVGQRLQAVGAVVFGRAELARGQIQQRHAEPGDAGGRRVLWRDRHQERRLARIQEAGVREGAGRDDAHDLALDEALGLPRVFDLIADRDAESLLHEARDVGVDGVVGDAAHRNAAAVGVLRTRRQRDLEGTRGHERVLIEHLVEIPHAEQQDRIAILLLGVQILPHRRSRRR